MKGLTEKTSVNLNEDDIPTNLTPEQQKKYREELKNEERKIEDRHKKGRSVTELSAEEHRAYVVEMAEFYKKERRFNEMYPEQTRDSSLSYIDGGIASNAEAVVIPPQASSIRDTMPIAETSQPGDVATNSRGDIGQILENSPTDSSPPPEPKEAEEKKPTKASAEPQSKFSDTDSGADDLEFAHIQTNLAPEQAYEKAQEAFSKMEPLVQQVNQYVGRNIQNMNLETLSVADKEYLIAALTGRHFPSQLPAAFADHQELFNLLEQRGQWEQAFYSYVGMGNDIMQQVTNNYEQGYEEKMHILTLFRSHEKLESIHQAIGFGFDDKEGKGIENMLEEQNHASPDAVDLSQMQRATKHPYAKREIWRKKETPSLLPETSEKLQQVSSELAPVLHSCLKNAIFYANQISENMEIPKLKLTKKELLKRYAGILVNQSRQRTFFPNPDESVIAREFQRYGRSDDNIQRKIQYFICRSYQEVLDGIYTLYDFYDQQLPKKQGKKDSQLPEALRKSVEQLEQVLQKNYIGRITPPFFKEFGKAKRNELQGLEVSRDHRGITGVFPDVMVNSIVHMKKQMFIDLRTQHLLSLGGTGVVNFYVA